MISLYVQEYGGIFSKFNTLYLHSVTQFKHWMPALKKQPWSNTRSKLCAIWENNLETFEKLFSMIQPHCSIYNHLLKPLHWNILEFWHQPPIVVKITVQDLEKTVNSLNLLHLTSINPLVVKIRLCFDTWCRVLCA